LGEEEKEPLIKRIADILGQDIAIVRNLSLIDAIAELMLVCESQAALIELWIKDDDES
jgi:hypothetical protein